MGNLKRRPEANAMAWVDLFDCQRKALAGLAGLINDSVNNLDEQPRGSVDTGMNWLIQGRTSSCALLDGKRGTGKTTVLATLYHATRSEEGCRSVFKGANDGTAVTVKGLVKRLVWLEPIDMEPDPPNFHLMAAILARIEKHFSGADGEREDDLAEPEGYAYSAWATPALDERRKALLRLRQLQTGLAYGWDGGPESKNGDPETIAGNITLSERTRMTVARKLEAVLKRLTAAWGRSGENQPLFILPIDDLDLAPAECLRLLRILRMLWIPQLFFLLIGDKDGIELNIHLELSGAMGKLCKDAKTEHVSIISDEVQSHIDSMASQTLRKLIPPPHRISLAYADAAAAMDLYPRRGIRVREGTENEQNSKPDNLVKLIKSMENAGGGAMEVLNALTKGIVTKPREVETKEKGAKKENQAKTERDNQKPAFYTGQLFFKTSLRRLTDFWYALDEIRNTGIELEEKQARLVNLFGEQCRMLIQEDGALSRERESDALSEIDMAETGEWFIGAPPIRVRSRCQPWLHTAQEIPESLGPSLSVRVIVQRPIEWEFLAERGSANDPTGRHRRLQPDTCGGLVILHDLLAKERVGAPWWSPWLQQPRGNTKTRDFRVWVFSEVTLPNHRVIRLRWPFVEGEAATIQAPRTFLNYDKLAHDWKSKWSQQDGLSKKELVLRNWLELCGCQKSAPRKPQDPDISLLDTVLFGGNENVQSEQRHRIRELAYEINDDGLFDEFWNLIQPSTKTKDAATGQQTDAK